MNADDRRDSERIPLTRPCKVFDKRSGKYVAGTTVNLSDGGAMVEFARPMDLAPGDRLFVGVALTRKDTVLPANEMIEGQVVRAVQTPTPATAVAVKFALPVEDVQPLRAAA